MSAWSWFSWEIENNWIQRQSYIHLGERHAEWDVKARYQAHAQ